MITRLGSRMSRLRTGRERGFALIFVLFVTTVVMIGTATTLSVVTGGVTSSRQNQDIAAARAAASAGVQRLLAALDTGCPSGSVDQCPLIKSLASTPLVGYTGAANSQRYTVTAINQGTGARGTGYLSLTNAGALFVTSTGVSPVAANGTPANGAVTRTITAAVSSKPNPLALAYFSNYETVGSSFLNSYYGRRTIALTSSKVVAALNMTIPGSVTWSGAATQSPSNDGDNICDKLWYDDPSNVNDGDTQPSGRATILASRNSSTATALPVGSDYEETGTLTGATSAAKTRYASCETTFTSGETFNGSVYSRDAFWLSNGTSTGSGPLFTVPTGEAQPALWTGWQSIDSPAAPVQNAYRSFPIIGGAPASGSGTVSSSPYAGLSLPSSTGITAGTCTFTGPTVVTLSGSLAIVTSPLTSSAGASCPVSPSNSVWRVPVTTTTIYVGNSASSLSSTALSSLLGLSSADITSYSTSAGDAYVSGTLTSGRLSIVTADDIIATGSILTRNAGGGTQPSVTNPASGERSWQSGSAAIDLVATNDVRVYHPVSCVDTSLVDLTATTAGWCPNDITGLYKTADSTLVVGSNGQLTSIHPSLQYANILTASSEPSEIDAAIFALNGMFYTDNFDRGAGIGPLLVSGGVYENHHGPLGEEWENPTGATSRAYSGFKLKINYFDYSNAGLGYVPELTGGNDLQPWQVVNVLSGGTS